MIFEPIFKALNDADVRYLVVGGLATVLHGHARLTGDVDLILSLEPANCRKGIQALVELGFRPRAPVDPFLFANREIREEWINSKGLTVFSLAGTSELPVEIDLFVKEPFNFEDLWTDRKDVFVGQTTVHVIAVQSLIALKQISARPQDLEDIRALKELSDG